MDVLYLNVFLFSSTFLSFCKVSGALNNPTDLKDLLNELSWSVKLKLWNDLDVTNMFEITTTRKASEAAAVHVPTQQPAQKSSGNARRVGVSSLVKSSRRQEEDENKAPAESPEENNMRMKLFRLMYETIRDSDLKVKRAELIREHYVNSTTFQTGYLLGDLTDKYNTITDISTTLQRFYKEWNSIEHINAYEQIANQAIEISHLIDMVRVMNKRDQQ